MSSKWIDVEVSRPIIGGTAKVKEALSLHPDLAIHGEVQEFGIDRLLVSHRCGIYLKISVGAIQNLRKKTIQISAHTTSRGASLLPCLTPSRQFLETVITASGPDSKPEDIEDLLWMKNNLSMELLSDPATLKKTWEEGRVGRVLTQYPAAESVFVNLGLAVVVDDDLVQAIGTGSMLSRSRSTRS